MLLWLSRTFQQTPLVKAARSVAVHLLGAEGGPICKAEELSGNFLHGLVLVLCAAQALR